MTDLFEQGLGYSAMNTVRSALSQVLHSPTGVPFGQLPTVKQFLKGVFQEKPTLPRYSVTWDPAILLPYLKTLSPVKELTLKMLTQDCGFIGTFVSLEVSNPLFLGH